LNSPIPVDDNNGNQTAGLGGLEASWDWRDRMNSATVNSTSSSAYAYDENDKRTRRNDDGASEFAALAVDLVTDVSSQSDRPDFAFPIVEARGFVGSIDGFLDVVPAVEILLLT
jgi:hypothetical protein